MRTGIRRGAGEDTGGRESRTTAIRGGTGEAGRRGVAGDRDGLAGRGLRVAELGGAAPDNPTGGSRVYTSGHRTVDGLCADARGRVYQTQDGPDVLNRLKPGGEYSSPSGSTDLPSSVDGVGGCATAGRAPYVAEIGRAA